MKTAISIRDDIFDAAERIAASLGLSRSALYAKAVEEFVARHDAGRLTERLDTVYASTEPALDEDLAALQFLSLPADEAW